VIGAARFALGWLLAAAMLCLLGYVVLTWH
jgi:hypothetical protein